MTAKSDSLKALKTSLSIISLLILTAVGLAGCNPFGGTAIGRGWNPGGKSDALLVFAYSTLTFGTVPLASTNTIGFALQNPLGGLAATSVSLRISGTGYSLSSNNCGISGSEVTINEGASCTFNVVFNPLAIGASTGTITTTYNNGSTIVTSSLSITAIADNAALLSISDGPTYSYSYVPLTTTTSKTFTVTNSGTAPATLGTVTLAGLGLAAPYSLTGGTCATGGSIAATGGTCTLIVAYTPPSNATNTGTISLSYDNGLSTTTTTRPITGTGNTLPVLTMPTNKLYPLDGASPPMIQGTQYTLTPSATDADGDTITFSCTYETLGLDATDPNYAAAATACTSLPSLQTVAGVVLKSTASFSTSTGALIWQPTNTQRGTYKFTIVANDGRSGTDTDVMYMTPRENYATSNIILGLDAQYSEAASGLGATVPSAPRLDATATDDRDNWLALYNSFVGTLTGFYTTTAPWSGVGTSTSPYRLLFDGVSDYMSFGTALNTATKILFSSWISPGSATSLDKVILGNGGGASNGFVLKQSDSFAGKLDLQIGTAAYSALILGDNPVSYWRLNEAAGNAIDLGSAGYNLTYNAAVTRNSTGLLSSDSNTAAVFSGVNDVEVSAVTLPAVLQTPTYSFEAWVTAPSIPTGQSMIVMFGTYSGGNQFLQFEPNSGKFRTMFACTTATGGGAWGGWETAASGTLLDINTVYHIVAVRDTAAKQMNLYINGILDTSSAMTNTNIYVPAGSGLSVGGPFGHNLFNFTGTIDEVAFYDYALTPQQIKNHYNAGSGFKFPSNSALVEGALGYWRLNESSGTTAFDSSASALNGSYSGDYILNQPGALSDSSDSAVEFGGTNAVVTGIGNTSTFRFIENRGIYTLAAWVKLRDYTTAGEQVVLGNAAGTGDKGIRIFYDGANDKYSAYVYGGTSVTVDTGNSSITDNNWHHIMLVGDGTNFRFYLDGVAKVAAALPTLGTGASIATLSIGRSGSTASSYFNGWIDEVSIYQRTLTTSEIASLYSTSNFYQCRSVSSFSDGTWSFISGLWDGTTASLFVNGKKECSVIPGSTYAVPATNLFAGATSAGTKPWQGSLAVINVYGTSDGSSPGSAANIKSDFDSTANRFRTNAVPEIVTSGLILNLDAANAKQGIGPFSTGCSTSSLEWSDLSTSFYTGNLINFSSADCSGAPSDGWQGAGTAANPYQIVFDGTNDYVQVASTAELHPAAVTLEAWIKTTSVADQYIFNQKDDGIYFTIGTGTAGKVCFYINTVAAAWLCSTGTVNDGAWHHIVGTYDGTTKSIYIDSGTPDTSALLGGSIPSGTSRLSIGMKEGVGSYFAGSMAKAAIYNRALTAQEISQNCNAMKSRFSGATCN